MSSYIRLFALASLFASSIGFGTFLPKSAPAQEKQEPKPGERVLLGPFGIDELYKAEDHREGGIDLIADSGGPSVDDMLKAMKEWKIYILDRKVKVGDRWIWDRTDKKTKEEYPKVLFEGRPYATLKDKSGKVFVFRLKEWSDFTTSLRQFGREPDTIAENYLSIEMQFGYPEMKIKLKDGNSNDADTLGFGCASIWYDVNGKSKIVEAKSKK